MKKITYSIGNKKHQNLNKIFENINENINNAIEKGTNNLVMQIALTKANNAKTYVHNNYPNEQNFDVEIICDDNGKATHILYKNMSDELKEIVERDIDNFPYLVE